MVAHEERAVVTKEENLPSLCLLRSLRRRQDTGEGRRSPSGEESRAGEGILSLNLNTMMCQWHSSSNASMPASDKFILHMLDPTHMFVQPHVADMIRSKISEFRDQNSYEKPS
uniref:General transcription and DNA repair factor IIH subunit TFB5 n=1 Tax=Oryza nivara TaxID=4536 RepID=A0A0E0H8G2_ORYNI